MTYSINGKGKLANIFLKNIYIQINRDEFTIECK